MTSLREDYNPRPKCPKTSNPRPKYLGRNTFYLQITLCAQGHDNLGLKNKPPEHAFKVLMSLGPFVVGFQTIMSRPSGLASCFRPLIHVSVP